MTNRYQVNSLYLHYPHCRHLCNYCDFFKSVPTDFDQARESFQSKLERHWELQAQWFEKLGYSFAPLETLYFGGGTPSLWDYSGAQWFESFMQDRFTLAKNYEWTMEVNPAAWTEKGLSTWEALGVNRFSMGVQSLDARYLKVLDRLHSLDDVEALLSRMKGKHFSVDLMLGLPFSSEWKRDLKFEIESLIERGAEHFSVYILTVKNNYKYFKELPSDEQIESEFTLTSEILRANGFDHYEVSNFARPNVRAKHNIRYWQGKSVAAIGPSAVGYLAQTGHRYKWKGQQDEFEIEELSSEAIELERVYLSLRLDSGLFDFELGLSTQQRARYQELYQDWLKAGWINPNSDRKDLCLSPAGFLMMDSVIESLMKAELIK